MENLVVGSKEGSTSRRTGSLTVGRNLTSASLEFDHESC
jgi:hypothetical protein